MNVCIKIYFYPNVDDALKKELTDSFLNGGKDKLDNLKSILDNINKKMGFENGDDLSRVLDPYSQPVTFILKGREYIAELHW